MAKQGPKSKVSLNDVHKAVAVIKEVIPLVSPTIEKHGSVVVEQVSKKTKQAGEALDTARNSVLSKLKQRKAASKSKKEQEETKRRIISQSLAPIDAKEFFKNFESSVSSADDLRNGYMGISGCYAIITMKSARDNNLANYKDVFVGCSDKVGFDVYSQLRGFGNIDVYADYKYGAPMKILAFPCDEGQLEENYFSLIDDLQAIDSYNKWDALESLEVQSE